MNWNALTVNASRDRNNTLIPIEDLEVTFVLHDGVNDLYYYFTGRTDINGNVVLPSSNTLVSQDTEVAVQTESERISNSNNENGDDSKSETGIDRTNYNVVQLDATKVSYISNWFASAQFNGTKLVSTIYPMSTEYGELRHEEDESGAAKGNTTIIKIRVSDDGIYRTGAFVTAWLYNSTNWDYVRVSGETISQVDAPAFIISKPDFTYDFYIVNAFYEGKSYNSNAHHSFTQNTTNIETVSVSGNGYQFTLGNKYDSYDTLFYYIGSNVDVYPYKMVVKDDNGNAFINYTVTGQSSISSYTNTCNTRYLCLEIAPYGNADRYAPTIKKLDIFGYIGGVIGSYTLLIPRLKYSVETPLVYDTIEPSAGAILGYNLPNTNIYIKFRSWPNWSYDNRMSSNDSAITITDSDIVCDYYNHDWFYRCLAGYNIGYQHAIKYIETKNHYNDKDDIFTLSAITLSQTAGHAVPYTVTSDTIDYLYVCSNEPGVNNIALLDSRVDSNTITREEDAVFTRKEIEDYVRGFGYTYHGNWGTPRAMASCDYDAFSLPLPTKTPPSKQYFYEDATSNLPGATIAHTLSDFKTNFIDELYSDTFITSYTKPSSLETAYTENCNHCYVMEETIIPSGKSQPDYLYFENKCDIPTDSEIISDFGQEYISSINTAVSVKLKKIGNPMNIDIQFSYNGHPWTDYTIGREIILLRTHKLYFKAKSSNVTFSYDDENFYAFEVSNDFINDDPNACQVSYGNLIPKYAYNTGTGIYNVNKIIDGINYRVNVGGLISTILNVSTLENSTLNNYGFYALFNACLVTSCENLKLDLLTVPNYGYHNMFCNTMYLKTGPRINATTVGTHAMDSMFLNSRLEGLKVDELYFTSPASYCCYRMFKNSFYNNKLNVNCTSNGQDGVSIFEEMFILGKGTNAYVNFKSMTIFATDCCKRMFYNSETTKFCSFQNPIVTIGSRGFYEMYRYSHINKVKFTIAVAGNVEFEGCKYMCADLHDNCNISEMQLLAEKLNISCYSHMFYNTDGLHGKAWGNLYLNEYNMSVSGCANMFYYAGEISVKNDNTLRPTSINNACYAYMFYHSGILTVPRLPATTLYEGCYSHMFDSSSAKFIINDSNGIKSIPPVIYDDEVETLLNAVELEPRCYEYMFANTRITRVYKVITEGLETAKERSCSHMFYNTNVDFTPSVRYICLNNDPYNYVTFRYLGQTTFAASNNKDNMRHPYLDVMLDSNGTMDILTSITINYLFGDYDFKGYSQEDCVSVNDCYLKSVGGVWKESHLTSTNPRTFSDFADVNSELRNFTRLGTLSYYSYYNPTYSVNGHNYSYCNYERFVELNATTLGEYCYEYMFSKCEKLGHGYNFRFGKLEQTSVGCFSHMFELCSSLRSLQPSIFGLTLSNNCFESMYSHCGNYESCIKGTWPNKRTVVLKKGLEIAGDYWYKCNPNIPTNSYGDFYLLTYAQQTTYDDEYNVKHGICLKPNYSERALVASYGTLQNSCFKTMFSDCNVITYPKFQLGQTTLADNCYEGMFCGCTQFVSGITLTVNSNSTAKQYCFRNMFKSCYHLIEGHVCNTLHKNLENNCYQEMFAYCYNMSAAPYLPATTLSNESYREMFYRAVYSDSCWSLKYSFTGKGYVDASTNYTDNIKVKLHTFPDRCYFEIDYDSNGGGDRTPRVKYYNGSTGDSESYRTYYTTESITGSMGQEVFQRDFLSGLTNYLSADETFGQYFKNANDFNGWSETKNYLDLGLPISYPNNQYINTHINPLFSKICTFITDKYYAVDTLHREVYDIWPFWDVVIVKINSIQLTDNLGVHDYSASQGVQYIKADLTNSQIGGGGNNGNRTHQWVYGLDINSGLFHKKSNGPTSYGENAIPNGWATGNT